MFAHLARNRSDHERATQLTSARKAALKAEREAELFPVHGYNNARVFSDPRARLLEKLSSAGITSQSVQAYVASMMHSLRPTAGQAREWQSQVRFGQ